MAIRKSDKGKYVCVLEKDYLALLEDHITMRALKIAGIEKMAIYQGIDSIIRDERIEIHLNPIKRKYK
jgi:hypothetical protein